MIYHEQILQSIKHSVAIIWFAKQMYAYIRITEDVLRGMNLK